MPTSRAADRRRLQIIVFDLFGVFIEYDLRAQLAACEVDYGAGHAFVWGEDYFAWESGNISDEEAYRRFKASTGYAKDFEAFCRDMSVGITFKEDVFEFLLKLKLLCGRDIQFWLLSNITDLHYRIVRGWWPGLFDNFFKTFLSFQMRCRKPDVEI